MLTVTLPDVRKQLWARGYRNEFAHHGSRVQDPVGTVLSTELLTDYHHTKTSWTFARISRSGHTQDIKMGSCVFQCDVPHKWIAQRQVALCLYTVTKWGVMSCVYGMTFLCGSTLVKVPLLQAGTVAIWPQMFKSDVEPKQTKQTNYLMWPIRWSYFPEMQRSFCPMHSNRRWPARSYVGHH